MTYGALKLRFVKAYPGLDIELIEGWIGDVYADILEELPWQRSNVTALLQTTAPYKTGTVSVVAGSADVALTGGTWDSTMTGRAFRVLSDDPYYGFEFVDAATGVLDRPYEGATNAAATYSIWQSVYLLHSDARMLEDNAFSQFTQGPLVRMDRSQLNLSDPARVLNGIPTNWTSYCDDTSDPPVPQVELWPVPDAVYGLPYTYIQETPTLDGTSVTLMPWVRPSALIEGTTAKIRAYLKDYAGATFALTAYTAALKAMRRAEAQGMAPANLKLDSYFTSYRQNRWQR